MGFEFWRIILIKEEKVGENLELDAQVSWNLTEGHGKRSVIPTSHSVDSEILIF